MKKTTLLTAACCALFFTGCTSTSVKYKTPKMAQIEVQNVNGQQLFFSSRASFISGQNMNNGYKMLIQKLIEQEFDLIFAETAASLKAFSSVNKTYFNNDDDLSVVNFNVEVQKNDNALMSLLTLCSLGIIPYHSSADFTVTCQFNTDGQSRLYTFEDSLSTWTGWFVNGTPDPYEAVYIKRLMLENIARHALVKYDQESSQMTQRVHAIATALKNRENKEPAQQIP